MMKHLISILLVCVLGSSFTLAQDSEISNNSIKYWNYRTRFVNHYISIGKEAGQSLPFGTRNEKELGKLSQGEGPIMLGQYIGVLATEYRLLKDNNQNTKETLRELYYALYAFNRLDLVAETSNNYNKLPKLDGYFVREDYPDQFVKKHPELNKNAKKDKHFIKGSGRPVQVSCTTDEGLTFCANTINSKCKAHANPKGYSKKYTHIPMSMDQMLGVLIGVSLVHELVDVEAEFSGNLFQDNETSIKKEAQNIAKRILSYAKKDHWAPREPDGDYIGDCEFHGKSGPNYLKNNATLYLFPKHFSHIANNIYSKKYGYFPLITALSGFGSLQTDNLYRSFYHRRMYIELMVLSNRDNNPFHSTANRVISASKKYNWETFYYALGKVLHHWDYSDKELESQTLNMLNNAPLDGTFFHGATDFSENGWATENRFTASLGAQYNGNRFEEITGNYSGLDYMLLHNLYLLAFNKNTTYFGEARKDKTKAYIHKSSEINVEKCVKGKVQSYKERHDYYRFLEKYILKNCKDSKAVCQQKVIDFYKRKFGKEFNEYTKKLDKNQFRKDCEGKLNNK